MTCLLDTHCLLWAVTDTKKLPKQVKELLTDPENQILVSSICFWEITLKTSIGKLKIEGFPPDDLPDICKGYGFELKSLTAGECSTYHHLTSAHHRDPFDRMLIWQAIFNKYPLITIDKEIRKYIPEGLRVYPEA